MPNFMCIIQVEEGNNTTPRRDTGDFSPINRKLSRYQST